MGGEMLNIPRLSEEFDADFDNDLDNEFSFEAIKEEIEIEREQQLSDYVGKSNGQGEFYSGNITCNVLVDSPSVRVLVDSLVERGELDSFVSNMLNQVANGFTLTDINALLDVIMDQVLKALGLDQVSATEEDVVEDESDYDSDYKEDENGYTEDYGNLKTSVIAEPIVEKLFNSDKFSDLVVKIEEIHKLISAGALVPSNHLLSGNVSGVSPSAIGSVVDQNTTDKGVVLAVDDDFDDFDDIEFDVDEELGNLDMSAVIALNKKMSGDVR